MQEETQETVTPEVQEAPAPKTQEQQLKELSQMAEFKQKSLSLTLRAHVADFLQTLAFRPGVSGNEKADMIVKFLDAVEGAMDYGLDVTNVKVPEKGSVGKRVATIVGILAQMQDNRMLLLAHQMQEAEKNNADNDEVKVEETQNDSTITV
jgi:hypothetical protein